MIRTWGLGFLANQRAKVAFFFEKPESFTTFVR
jgi:hypothetical protein